MNTNQAYAFRRLRRATDKLSVICLSVAARSDDAASVASFNSPSGYYQSGAAPIALFGDDPHRGLNARLSSAASATASGVSQWMQMVLALTAMSWPPLLLTTCSRRARKTR